MSVGFGWIFTGCWWICYRCFLDFGGRLMELGGVFYRMLMDVC